MKILLTIISCSVLLIGSISGQKLKPKEKKEKIGFVLGKKKIIGYQYDSYEETSPNNFIVTKNGVQGFVGNKGNLIIECKYEEIVEYTYDKLEFKRFRIKKGEKYGVIGENEEEILPFEYDAIANVTENSAFVRHDGKWKELELKTMNFVNENVIFKVTQQMPLFGNCYNNFEDVTLRKDCSQSEMLKHIYSNIEYPKEALEQRIEGTIVVRFIVNEKGEIVDPKVVREIGGGCGEEGVRVTKQMPNWYPAIQNGFKSSVYFNLPIKFRLE